MPTLMNSPATDELLVTAAQGQSDPGIASQHVYALFQEYRSRPFILVEPLGNYGDQLIWKGAQKLARLAGLNFESMPYPTFVEASFPDEAVVYIHGGGGINPRWSGSAMKAFLKAIVSHPGVTILGPQTFPTDVEFLRQAVFEALPERVPGKVYLFTRENTSYNSMKTGLPGWIELGLDHDTALNLTAVDLTTETPQRHYTFYAIREDREAVQMQQRDLLAVWLDPAVACSSFDHWVAIHNGAERIVSNRLHSSIVGLILGVPTTILANSYHKNRSVWEHSLRQRSMQWADGLRLQRRARILNAIYPLRKVIETNVVQDMMRTYVHKAPAL